MEEYRDVSIQKGVSIEIPHILGYTFQGYEDEQGTKYIDENGNFVRDYYGTELLTLWAQYIPDEYEIVICENNMPLENFNKIICKYDAAIYNDLPFGREIKKDRKEDKEESYVVIGFADEDSEQIISLGQEEVTLKSLGDYANHEEKELMLNIVSTDITYFWNNLNTRIISNDGFLKQNLEGKCYDTFSTNEDVDLDILKALGYKEAVIKLEFSFETEAASPRIVVLNQAAVKKKELKKNVIIDTDKIRIEELEGKNYCNEYIIPMEELTGEFYVYYNSEDVLGKEWNCTSITMEIRFVK